MGVWLSMLLDRMCAILCAFIFSQIPLFMHQYTGRLSGHIDELKLQLEKLSAIAQLQGKTMAVYIEKFLASSDADFQQQGIWMQSLVERYQQFSYAINAINESSAWKKPFVFFHNINPEVAMATLKVFLPGVPFSVEGFCYAFVGVLCGLCLYKWMSFIVCFLFIKRKSKLA